MISKLGGKNSLRLEGIIDFDKIDLKKINSNSNDIVTIAKEDIQEAIQIFIRWRERVIKEHRAGGKPKTNALSEVSANQKTPNSRLMALVPNALNQKRSVAPDLNSDLSLKEYFFDKLASKSPNSYEFLCI
jgi:hypothetical protein